MKVELINSLDYLEYDGIKRQLNKVISGNSDELWIATPHEDAAYILKEQGFDLEKQKVFDIYSQQYIKDQSIENGLWWADYPLPNNAQILVDKNWDVKIRSYGKDLAQMFWFANSDRLVKSVVWTKNGNEIDYKEIFQRNGKLFAKQYFSGKDLLQTDFYFENSSPMVSEFYFEGMRNLVFNNKNKFSNSENYVRGILESYGYEFNISQLGRELEFAPTGTSLTLYDGVLNEEGQIFGNLVNVLDSNLDSIKDIYVKKEDYLILEERGVSLNNVKIFVN